MKTMPVSKTTKVGALAGAIASEIRSGNSVELQCIGPGPINQAVKAVALARKFPDLEGFDLVAVPGFVPRPVVIDGDERTVFRLFVGPR